MAVVQTATRSGVAVQQNGIRPFELARDLRPVANLIADAFAHELDERGAAALREMRMMSRFGGLLGVINMASSDFADVFGGFVWVEGGEVVGNITVQRADKYGARWQIANVAVAKPFRGRGLSRRLMERAISHIREHGGKWAVLQVYAENTIARTLYDHMGFETLGGMTDFQANRASSVVYHAPDEATLHSFGPGDWQSLYELANNQTGSLAQWWRPLRRSDFQRTFEQQTGDWMWEALGRRTILRHCVQSGHRFEAAAVLTIQRWQGPHRLQLWARPENYGLYEESLLRWALHALREEPAWPVTVSAPAEHEAAADTFARWGFTPVRSLLTMRLGVTPE